MTLKSELDALSLKATPGQWEGGCPCWISSDGGRVTEGNSRNNTFAMALVNAYRSGALQVVGEDEVVVPREALMRTLAYLMANCEAWRLSAVLSRAN